MDRSIAARTPAGRRRSSTGAFGGAALPGMSAGALAGAARRLLGGLLARRGARIALSCCALAAPVLGGGWLLLRHSSLTAVEHVRISGVHGPQAHQIETALQHAARGMSTLGVSRQGLMEAVAAYPTVATLSVSASFPHSLRIQVVEQPPVAALIVAGAKTAVAADGVALGPSMSTSTLPVVADDAAPAAGGRVRNPLVLDALALMGAAPPALDRLAERVYDGPRGLTVTMRNGLQVYFGEDTLAHAKWLSLASVLADPSSAGAIYVDVRVPGRPAAGFAEGSAHAEASNQEGREGAESTVSSLAAALTADSPEPKQSGGSEGATSTSTSEPSTSRTEASAGEGASGETAER